MIKYEKQVLPNGLRVFYAPMHETQAVTLLFLFGVGSRYETTKQNGLSHFLEHMFFKGTERRPSTLDISQELDSLGAEYNAFTGEEYTGYYISTAAEHFPIAFDVLTDMLYNSAFDSAEIKREKGVICEEIKMYHDNPMTYLEEVSKTLVFGNTPLGRDIAGKPETVKRFKQEDFLRYKQSHYGAENTILVIAGNPNKHNWQSLITGSLSHVPKAKKTSYEKQKELSGSAVNIGHKPIDQVHLSLIHYGFPHKDPRVETLDVLTNILGGTMSSRLFVEVREKRGLAYYARSSRNCYNDIGTVECNAGVDPKKLEEAVTVTLVEINKLKTEAVSDLELDRAKQNIKGRLSLRLEDSHSIARYLAYDELELGHIRQPEKYIKLIEKVTKSDIIKLANDIFTDGKRKLALVGPLGKKDEEKLEKLIA